MHGSIHRIKPVVEETQYFFDIFVPDENPPFRWNASLFPDGLNYTYSNLARFRSIYLFSDPHHKGGFGRISVIANDKLIAEIIGDDDTFRIGEHIWIGGTTAEDESGGYGDIVIGTSTRDSLSDTSPYHIQLLKLFRLEEGGFKLYKYGSAMLTVQAYQFVTDDLDSIVFKDGNFFFIEINSLSNTRRVRGIRICSNTEYYDTVTNDCYPCPESQGTVDFQQESCMSCGDLWYGASKTSIEYITARRICSEPEEHYYTSHPAVLRPEVAAANEVIKQKEEVIKDAQMKMSLWWIVIGVLLCVFIIAAILVLFLLRTYKHQQ